MAKTISPALDRMFEAFQGYLYDSSGIYFSAQNRERLLTHVATRMEAVGEADPARYLALLKGGRGFGGERGEFFNQATVNETYFFREEPLFDVLRDKVLPRLYQERVKLRRKKVVIWSAACSSGEEAYSLAILVLESFAVQTHFTSIVGIDINSEVIRKAQAGEYNDYAVRSCSPKQKSVFFTKNGGRYQIRPDLKDFTTFERANLADEATLRHLPRPDLILCRNALIYFDKASKERVIRYFGATLQPNGYLFLGRTESLFGLDHPLDMVHYFKTAAFRPKG